MVNRKREPWWNRKSEVSAATAAAVSRRSKFLTGQRVSTNSAASDVVESEIGVVATTESEPGVIQAKLSDVNSNCDKESNVYNPSASDGVAMGDAANDDDDGECYDVTPTRDEPPIWEVIDNTNDDIGSGDSNNMANTNGVGTSYNVIDSADTYENPLQQNADNGSASNNEKPYIHGIGERDSDVRVAEFYGPPEPCLREASPQTWENDLSAYSVVSNVDDDLDQERVEKSENQPKKQRKRRKSDHHGSVESDKSTNTLSSDGSLSKDRTSSVKSSYHDKHYKHSNSKEDKLAKKRSKKSKSGSRDKDDDDSPRRPRKLPVQYDRIRQRNGTALPERTYDPLDPLGLRSKVWNSAKTKPYTQRYKSSYKHGHGSSSHHDISSAHHRHRSSSTEKSKRSSSESTESLHKSESTRSSSQDLSISSKSRTSQVSPQFTFPEKFSKEKPLSGTGNKFFSSSSNRYSSKLSRSKSAYSTHVKRTSVKKHDKPVETTNWMKLNTDGIGIQKIRPNQKKTFMATCVEEYSLRTNGSMAKDVKPLLAFKIGNPQFVSEFYEKKTELDDLPVDDGMLVTKIMKEKFAFKVKIGLDKLDKFITEGITVSGQNTFFSQFRNPPMSSTNGSNAVLLYRYADICLAWTSSKNIGKSTPIFLLIHKVVYGRSKTYHHLGEAMYVKEDHHCDCLKASLSGMQRKDADDNEIRKGLACSKVILADFDPNTGHYRDRPRQILPYAIVLYARDSLSETEQADLKQSVLEWKRQFEVRRWKMATAELNNKQMLLQQQALQSSYLPLPDNMAPSQVPWQSMGSSGSVMSAPPPVAPFIPPPGVLDNAGLMPPPGSLDHAGLMPPPGLANCSVMPPSFPIIENPHLHAGSLENAVYDAAMMSRRTDNLQSPNFTPIGGDNTPPAEEKSFSRKRRRSRSNSSIESEDRLSSKSTRKEKPVDVELDRVVSEALASHRRSLQTKDVGVQVKTQSTIISLQKKNVSLCASTQTPDLDKEDGYEARLLRGKPLEPPACVHCKSKIDATGAVIMNMSDEIVLSKVFVNKNERPRKFKSLTQRFSKTGAAPDMDDILLDEKFDST